MSASRSLPKLRSDQPDQSAGGLGSSLGHIRLSSLREEARRKIRAGVITGEMQPGEIYSASSLADSLGVSATPVREALIDLANAGLVEPVRNRGFRVVVLNDGDLDEIFQLRTLLEVPSVGQVAGSLGAAHVERLQAVVANLENAAETGDLARYLTLDQDFHSGLLEPLGNRRLSELVTQMRDQQRLFGLRGIVHSEAFLSSAFEHRAILDAVAEGDKPRAESLTLGHLRHTRGEWAAPAGQKTV
jgi:DNA-binding GntR family transcriptional regulator